MPDDGNTYGDRNQTLLELGFTTYEEYLQSDLWGGIKERAYEEHGRTCHLCNNSAQVIHHVGYGKTVLLGESLAQLAPLCFRCHEIVEFSAKGDKLPLRRVQEKFLRLLTRRRKEKVDSAIKRGRCVKCGCPKKRNKQYCTRCQRSPDVYVRVAREGHVQVTETLLSEGAGPKGGWSRKQLEVLGVPYPPRKEWRKNLVGSFVPDVAVAAFLRLKRTETAADRRRRKLALRLANPVEKSRKKRRKKPQKRRGRK